MKLAPPMLAALLFSAPAFALSITTTSDALTLGAASWIDTGAVNVTGSAYSGYAEAAGTFTEGPLGIMDGVILTSGLAQLALPPDDSTGAGWDQNLPGDALCDALIPGYTSYDAARLTLTFDLAEDFDGISFQFVFGSEEYPEYVGTSFNDVLGIYLTGPDGVPTQVAFDDEGNPITINGPFFSGDAVVLAAANGTQYDGSTGLLTTRAPLAGGTYGNTLDIIVCDAGDHILDSGVFFAGLNGCVGDDCTGTVPCKMVDVDGDLANSCDDCDDTDPGTYPGAVEVCDELDNDCDGEIDEDGACVIDEDEDGVLDDDDLCPETAPGDVVDEYGCSIDQYCPCDADVDGNAWKNHGAYVSCVAHAANDFMAAGLITGPEHGDIVSDAGTSSCGKTGGKGSGKSGADDLGEPESVGTESGCSATGAAPATLAWLALSALGLVTLRRRD